MGWIRILYKAPLLAAICGGAYLAASWGGPLVAFRGSALDRALARGRWQGRVFRRAARMVGGVLGMKVEVEGDAPEPPFVLVSNHLSYVDVILIGSELGCVFISKAEVEDWPLIGRVVRSVGTLFIDRGAKRDLPQVAKRMEDVLESGRGIIFFPEGTTSRGDRVAPFRPSLLEPAVRTGRPVHYASVSYRTETGSPPAERSICWWGDMKFKPHILQLLALPRFRARLRFGAEPIREEDRKLLATRLQRAIQRQFEAVG